MTGISRDELGKLTSGDIAKILNVEPASGLSEQEAKRRISDYGFNEIAEEKKSTLLLLARKFWNASAWVLEAAALISFLLGKLLDFYVILALIVFNAVLSYSQELKANDALEKLKEKLQIRVRVKRDGNWIVTSSRFIVPGDIVRVRAGDFVPADLKISEGEVETDQSALTGESLTVSRKVDDVLYSGSVVKRGEATGIAALTGRMTYFGRTAELVKIARPRLRIERVIERVVAIMVTLVIVLIGVALISFILRGEDPLLLLPLVLVLIVGSIPIALPAMFSISLALGAEQLSGADVLVTRLDSIEGAATMDVLASDKTGTITMNRMNISRVVPYSDSEEDILLFGALASDEANQDPIDMAFMERASERIRSGNYKVKNFVPFDPSTRRTEATAIIEGREITVTKGAVNTLLELCTSVQAKEIEEKATSLASSGSRVLAVAHREGKGDWKFAGLVSMSDPPRPDSAELIRDLKNMGVRVKMLTGDAVMVARDIAVSVGIGDRVVSAKELSRRKEEAAELAWESDGFAEVYPEDKYMIVGALQKSGHIVGMTGDGVNDAPALRQADVGIAVSSATDVAKSAAGVVLTSPGLVNAVSLIRIGRQIYERVNTWTLSRLTRTFQNVVFVTLALLITGIYVISAFDMVLLLFLFDFVTLSLSTDNVRWPSKPASWNIRNLVNSSSLLGSAMMLESFVPLYFLLHSSLKITELQTLVFGYLLFSNIFNLMNIRERGNFWTSRPSSVLLLSIGGDIVLAFAIMLLGIPGLMRVPFVPLFLIFTAAILFNLIANNFLKTALHKFFGVSW